MNTFQLCVTFVGGPSAAARHSLMHSVNDEFTCWRASAGKEKAGYEKINNDDYSCQMPHKITFVPQRRSQRQAEQEGKLSLAAVNCVCVASLTLRSD